MSDERIPKSRRKSQIRAVNKYAREHYDRIGLYTPVGTKELWTKEAKARGFDGIAPFVRWCVSKIIESGEMPPSDSGIDNSERNDKL